MTVDRDNLLELPTGWVWAETGDICEGIVPGRTKPKNFDGTIPWITLPDVTGLYISKSKSHLAVTREDAEEVGMRVMPKGTVLMSCVGQFGIICIAEDDLVPNQQFHGFLCLDEIFPEYIAYSLMTQVDQMKQLSSATTIAYINKTKCNSIQIPLAPLKEQRRIVAKIEALKARSQRVKEELEAIPALLDQFRQSVLAAAFRGDLTADWRQKNPDIEPVTRVVESLREKRFSQARTPAQLQKLNEIYSSQEEEDSNLLPESWRYIALEKLCDSFQYGTSAKSLASGKVPVLRMGNIQNGEIDGSDLVYTSDEDEIEKYKLKIGDVLFNRTNSPELVGKTGIYRGEHQAIFAGYLIKINNTQELDSEYLNYCLNTGYAKEYCWRVKTDGVSQSNINAQKLGKFELPFCSLEEQREVVRRINSLFLVANRLKQNYKEAKAYLDQLDRSILAKAFRGELVPQDPNDEPASVLLERIRAEREKLDTKKKAKGKTEKKSRKAKPEPAEPKQLSLPGFE
ncbi:restriction endonuclease subunit S [Tychonema sp. LEGE 07203]|uniref:restriction endonuclease subunit S n=1 Tax=Tychonema sp. LEGE 07203 TaxID=1828671 RepID=UPI00351C93EA